MTKEVPSPSSHNINGVENIHHSVERHNMSEIFLILDISIFYYYAFFVQSINSDLHRGLGRRLRHTQH